MIFVKNNVRTDFIPLDIDEPNNIAWFKQDNITYSVAYCRPQASEHTSNKTQNFYKSLKRSIAKNAPTDDDKNETILVADFNARAGLHYHETKGVLNYNGKELIKFINSTNLKLATPMFQPEIPTYRDGHGGASQIDHVITKDPRDLIEYLKIDSHPMFINDHSPVIFALKNEDVKIVEHTSTFAFRNTPLENTEKECEQMLEKHKRHITKLYDQLQENATTEKHQKYISKVITYLCIYTLHKAAIIRFGLRKIDSTNPWTPTNIDLLDVNSRITMIENDDETSRKELKKLKKKHKIIINQMQKQKTIKNTDRLRQQNNSESSHAMACFFKRHNAKALPEFLKENDKYTPFNEAMSKHLKHTFQKKICSTDQTLEDDSKEYYDELMQHNADRLDVETPLIEEEDEQMDNEEDLEDKPSTVESALKSMKLDGAPGIDRLNANILIGIKSEGILEILYNTWLQTIHIPAPCKQGMIQSLAKITNPTKAEQYRPITLLPIFYKTFERIMLWKLINEDVEKNLHILQGGFRVQRGVSEMLNILRIANEVSMKENKPFFCCSLDVKKAYDTVPRDKILYKLKNNFGISNSICQVIQEMLRDTRSAMKSNNHVDITHSFETYNGVQQGSVIAPILYGVFINDLVEQLNNQNMGITIANEKHAALAYCDDNILLTNEPDELSKLLKICEEHSHTWQYRFNPDKCKTIVHNYEHTTNSEYNAKQKQQIQTKYNDTMRSKVLIKPAPAIITEKMDNTYFGTDIHNRENIGWLSNELPPTHRISIEQHFKYQDNFNTDIPYDVHWDDIEEQFNMRKYLEQICKLENESIPCSPEIKYLGSYLHEQDPQNILSSHITTNNFIKKLKAKENYLHKLNINYNTVPLHKCINLTKSAFTAYTEVYAQVLPQINLDRIDTIAYNIVNKVLPVYESEPNQLHYYTKIPKPSERWIQLQLCYHRKLHKMDTTRSKMAYWTQNNSLPELPYFQNCESLCNKWIPNWDPKTDTISDYDSVLETDSNDESESKQQDINAIQLLAHTPKQIELTNQVLNGTKKYKQTMLFREIYNKHLLQLILETPNEILEEVLNENKKHKADYVDKLKKTLRQYDARSKKTKFVPVDYRHSRRDTVKLERRYLKKTKVLKQNLQTYSKLVRGVLADGLYWDIDICNCFPNLILHMCKINQIPCEYLETYVKRRPYIMNEILNKNNNLTRDKIKQTYISLINGGKKDYNKIKHKTTHLKCFKIEIATIVEQLKTIYPIPWNYSKQKPQKKDKKKSQPEGAFVSLLCSRLENYILQLMITYIKCKYFKHKPRMTAVLCFDGIMFPKTIWKNISQRDNDITKMQTHIKHMTDIPIQLVCKDFKPKLLNKILEYHNNKPNEPIHNNVEFDNDSNTNDNVNNCSVTVTDFETDEDSDIELVNYQNSHNYNNHNHNHNYNIESDDSSHDVDLNSLNDDSDEEDEPRKLTDDMYKAYVVKTLNENSLSQFHPLYPLKVINWCPNTRSPFKLIEESCLDAENKITHLKQYRKLFYKFGTLKQHTRTRDVCNLCNQHINPNTNAMEKHIFMDCAHLNHLRANYWKQAHNELAEIYNKPYNTHQIKFAQYVLESIQKLTVAKDNFWKIASGANTVKKNKQTFKYDLFWQKLEWFRNKHNQKRDVFYIKLLDKLANWYHICHDILLDKYKSKPNKMTVGKQLKKYKHTRYNYNYHSTCLTDKDWQHFKRRNKITQNDIIISTDGSFQHITEIPEGRAGYGIYVEHKKVRYRFWQALGQQTNNYAEITALAKIKQLLRRLNIIYTNKRIFILTDSEIAFNMCFQKPKRDSEYPELHKQLLENIWDIKPTLIKITSHLDIKRTLPNNEENEEADKLAEKAAKWSLKHPSHKTPLFDSWLLSKMSPAKDPECWRQIEGWNEVPD